MQRQDAETNEHDGPEPSIEGAFADDGIDLTVIAWMLELTPAQRLQAVQDLLDAADAIRSGAGNES